MEPIDSWEIDGPIKGLKFRVTIVRDDDVLPYVEENGARVYDECYDKKDIEAWHADKWEFVITIVTPVFRGIPIGEATASLGGTQWGDYWNLDNRRCVDHVLAPTKESGYDLPGECMDYLKGAALDVEIMSERHTAESHEVRAQQLGELRTELKIRKA